MEKCSVKGETRPAGRRRRSTGRKQKNPADCSTGVSVYLCKLVAFGLTGEDMIGHALLKVRALFVHP